MRKYCIIFPSKKFRNKITALAAQSRSKKFLRSYEKWNLINILDLMVSLDKAIGMSEISSRFIYEES